MCQPVQVPNRWQQSTEGIVSPDRLRTPSGLALAELLTVIGIIVILLSILAPALQRARSAARRTACQQYLRQIALSLQQYTDAHRVYPPLNTSWHREINIGQTVLAGRRNFSFLCHLLPFLGRSDLYQAINFSVDGVNDVADAGYGVIANWTVIHTTVGIFLCPADHAAREGGYCSYRGSTGVLDPLPTRRGWPDSGHGVFRTPAISPSHIADGLTQTAALSERLVGTRSDADRRDRRAIHRFSMVPPPNRTDQYTAICTHLTKSGPRPWFGYAGRFWLLTGPYYTLYNHVLPPNSAVIDCLNADHWGAVSARSAHPGGVNVAFADGHVRFVSDSVELSLWRALGTRDGGEPIEDGF